MLVLVINCGSSSIKADIVDAQSGRRATQLRVERLGTSEIREKIAALLQEAGGQVGAVGHRVVHGGDRFVAPTRITDAVEEEIESLVPLAPLHNPANLAGIRAARAVLPNVPHVAVFDTAFHATLPPRARSYALPQELTAKHGIRRYGFHGTSHGFVARRAADFLGDDLSALRLITCHLGNGASVAAVEHGRSIETSMGMTPLEGLVMGTRAGDVDPGVLLQLLRAEDLDLDADGLDHLLNRESGLAGLSGVGNDMRDIEARAREGDDRCRLAIRVFAHRVRKYIGAYAAVLGGVDAIVFTGGIGENSATVRHMVTQRLEFLGARLDEEANRAVALDADRPVAAFSTPHSRTKLLAVATDEQLAIARLAAAVANDGDRVEKQRPIPIAVSARHIHLTQEMVEKLFGEGHTLTPRNDLSQPGQFACEETLTVVGPKRSLPGVRVLGPTRSRNQVEISRTDEFFLGVDAPVRNSGDTKNTPGITLVGPKATVTLEDGLICAARHIHMTPEDARAFGVDNGDIVEVAVDTAGRDLIFGDVLIRVSPKYALEMHVDTDEANAAELPRQGEGMLVATPGTARLRRKRVSS